MSNSEASKLYETIVKDVIESSRPDFFNNDIDESILEELKRIWCDKLTQTRVAEFSWDEEKNHVSKESEFDSTDYHRMIMKEGETMNNFKNYDFDLLGGGDYGFDNKKILRVNLDEEEVMFPKLDQSDGMVEITVDGKDAKDMLEIIRKGSDGMQESKNDLSKESDFINSDLDDDLETEKSENNSEDHECQIMLCLYDKVQRVKNKWKFILKEGIANIHGKDYVFQKASGESDW